MPIAAFAITISFLALAGVPPLNGFWSKLLLFTAALNAGSIVWWAPWLAIAAALNSALSLGYYAWVIKRMYLDEPQSDLKVKEQPSYIVPLLITTTLIVLTGIYWNPILTIAADSVLGLLLPR
jgi:NADH-quinone oxidoreductase subunit N